MNEGYSNYPNQFLINEMNANVNQDEKQQYLQYNQNLINYSNEPSNNLPIEQMDPNRSIPTSVGHIVSNIETQNVLELESRIEKLEKIILDLEHRLENQANAQLIVEKKCEDIDIEWGRKYESLQKEVVDWKKKFELEVKKGNRLRDHLSRTEREMYGMLQRKYELIRGPGQGTASAQQQEISPNKSFSQVPIANTTSQSIDKGASKGTPLAALNKKNIDATNTNSTENSSFFSLGTLSSLFGDWSMTVTPPSDNANGTHTKPSRRLSKTTSNMRNNANNHTFGGASNNHSVRTGGQYRKAEVETHVLDSMHEFLYGKSDISHEHEDDSVITANHYNYSSY